MENLQFNEAELIHLLSASQCKYSELKERGLNNVAGIQLRLSEKIIKILEELENSNKTK